MPDTWPTPSNAFSPGKATRLPPQTEDGPHVRLTRRGSGESHTLGRAARGGPGGAAKPGLVPGAGAGGRVRRGCGEGRRPLGLENKLAIRGTPAPGTPCSPRPASSQGADERHAVRRGGSKAAEGRRAAEEEYAAESEAGIGEDSRENSHGLRTPPLGGHPGVPAPPSRRKRARGWGRGPGQSCGRGGETRGSSTTTSAGAPQHGGAGDRPSGPGHTLT